MSTISQDGGTIYFRYESSTIQYSTANLGWTNASFPITINNLRASSPTNVLTVEFTTDLTFNNVNNYFRCGSSYITFDGKNKICTYSNIPNYNGLIQNGTSTGNGFSNITVQNISANSNETTLAGGKGWICQDYFGKGSLNCIVNNCNSSGAISASAGGILGRYAGYNGGSVNATNCFSSGTISGASAGGIFGSFAGYQGLAITTNCYSTGAISGSGAGGIFGSFAGAGETIGSATATNCYSSGAISDSVRGIFGVNAGNSTATNCYIANGAWANATANANLTGTPTLVQNPGATWFANPFGEPYYLASFLTSVTEVTIGSSNLTINIIGTNLLNTNSITINGFIHPLSFLKLSNSLIIATLENVYPIVSVMVTTSDDISSNVFIVNPPIYPTCFPSGTPILTDQGIVAIEKINKKIHTINNKKIIAITQTITNEEHLVCIEKNALGLNIPSEKTIISRCHGVLYNDKMVQSRYLKNMVKNKKSINNIKYNGEMLYNILMEEHDTMSVNNMTVETLDPKNIIAKLYSGKYNEIQKHNLIIEINDCVKKNNFKKIEALRAKL